MGMYAVNRSPSLVLPQDGSTPLFRAVQNEEFKIAETLIDHKADVNAQDKVCSGDGLEILGCFPSNLKRLRHDDM